MKSHLKRLAAPKTWILDRKANIFTVHPTSSGHPLQMSLPLGIIIRDVLRLTNTMKETQKLLNSTEVLVDHRRRKDYHLAVGLFDVLRIPALKKAYRVTLDRKGRVIVKEINGADQELKPCKVTGKSLLRAGKIQYHLHDGKNIITEKTAKVGDTLLMALPQFQIKEVLQFKPGMLVFFTSGKHSGDVGELKQVKGNTVTYTSKGNDIETAKAYAFVLGSSNKPCIEV